MKRRALTIYALLTASAVLLGLGLVAPCMTVYPSMGETWDSWLAMLKPEMLEPTSYSILSGIMQMIRGEDVGLGLLLLAFSAVFPAFKLVAQWWGVSAIQSGGTGGPALAVAYHAGKYSMLDVMVIAVLLIAIKGLPGETEITIDWGLYAFAASVVLSILASVMVKGVKAVPAQAP